MSQTKSEALMEYAQGFVSIDNTEQFAADDLARRLSDTKFVAALPDMADRE